MGSPPVTSSRDLEALEGCCVVIDKGASSQAVQMLAESDNGMLNVSPGLRDIAPAIDGEPVLLGPTDNMPQYTLGALRVAGWRGRGRSAPLMHAKILVFGELRWAEDDFGTEDLYFFRRSVWWGSANWTAGSGKHLEAGFWSDDAALVRHKRATDVAPVHDDEPADEPEEVLR